MGEDSLEANVGHLAALTGGEIFVSNGADLAEVLNAALVSLRTKHYAFSPITGKPQHISVRRAGMTVTAKWQEAEGLMEETVERRAVAAVAASLALPAFDTESAARLAETEGLVTHLTSLVLVDEAGAVQDGIPATRKIALPAPHLSAMVEVDACIATDFELSHEPAFESINSRLRPADLSGLGARIDWEDAPLRLQAGDLSALDREVARAIRSAAAHTEVVVLARQLALDPVALVIGLIARSKSSRSRSAARLAKAIFGDIALARLDNIAQLLRSA